MYMADKKTLKVGSKVKCSATKDVNGTHLAAAVRKNTYTVSKINGNKVTISKGKTVIAVVSKSTLTVVGGHQLISECNV